MHCLNIHLNASFLFAAEVRSDDAAAGIAGGMVGGLVGIVLIAVIVILIVIILKNKQESSRYSMSLLCVLVPSYRNVIYCSCS